MRVPNHLFKSDDIEDNICKLNFVPEVLSESESPDSGLRNIVHELDKHDEVGETVNDDLADIVRKVWKKPQNL